MWFSGWTLEKATSDPYRHDPMIGDFIYWRNADGRRFIKRSEIAGYFNSLFQEAIYQWRMWRSFGLPHGGGWLHERPEVLQVIALVEDERTYYETRESEERRKNGNSRRTTSSHTR